jgi:hypothetical protein
LRRPKTSTNDREDEFPDDSRVDCKVWRVNARQWSVKLDEEDRHTWYFPDSFGHGELERTLDKLMWEKWLEICDPLSNVFSEKGLLKLIREFVW